MTIIHAGCTPKFVNVTWYGHYQLKPFPIYDGAMTFHKGMYLPGSFYCLSFHHRKLLPIGKGGMILTDDEKAYNWFLKARYEGRDSSEPYSKDNICSIGWNMYMTPEDAARGVLLFDAKFGSNVNRDLRQMAVFVGD